MLEDEDNLEQNISLVYRHISFRASKILKSKMSLLKLHGRTAIGGTGKAPRKVMASFGFQETELLPIPTIRRSNSFKLGPRPREMKDRIKKEYRRNSIHLETGIATSAKEFEESETGEPLKALVAEREQEVINL